MRVRPSVVFGLGSSGAYVISNIERLLYEVVGDTPLDFLKMIAIDTDTTRKEDEPPPGGHRRQNLPIHESNLGRAIRDLRAVLKEHFDWLSGADIHIPGAGAGNLRGGGRLMLFNKLPDLWQTIQRSTHEVEQAARQPQTEARLREAMTGRGIAAPPGLVNADSPVAYVIGTLAGGTGSGSVVDFGYMLRDASPHCFRIGVFFIPDRSANVVFQENAWSALKDLEYFCQHPQAFRSAWWPEANHTARRYGGEDGTPYDLVYLLSEHDEHRVFKLKYSPNAASPLISMAALQVTADVLGLFDHRSALIANINAQVPGEAKHHMFLNFNLRAVCYPKYELSEAAACRAIDRDICELWLNTTHHQSSNGRTPIREEEWRSVGRRFWNERFESVWRGAQSSVDLATLTRRLLDGGIAEPEAELRHQFSGNVQGTIHSQVGQELPNRLGELQRMAREGLAATLQQTRNLRAAELFLDGFRQEIVHTLNYWTQLGVPPHEDEPAWRREAADSVEIALRAKSHWPARLLNARSDVLRDELQALLNKLGMFLLRRTLAEFTQWMDRHLSEWLTQLRRSIEAVQDTARNRHGALIAQLNSAGAPVLRLSRSSSVGFEQEIGELVARPIETSITYLRYAGAESFEGIFAVTTNQDAEADRQMFLTLKNLVQPELLRRLQAKGPVDIVAEITAQGRVPQAVSTLKDTHALSLATKLSLVKGRAAVPSFICARDLATAERLEKTLRVENPELPEMLPKALPIFDHMAIFYQEGAKLDPDLLADAESFAEKYAAAMADPHRRPELLDPLATLKGPSKCPPVVGGAQ